MTNLFKLITLGVLFLSVSSVNGQQVIDSKFGKGLYNVIAKDSSWSMKFGLRFQSLYMGEIEHNNSTGFGDNSSRFMIRRARLKFDGFAFTPKLKYKIELGVSNSDLGKVDATTNEAPRMILDAVLMWNFYQNFELWAGQTKLPGNRERVISSANMQLVDRSQLNSVFNIDRDMGVQVRHHFKLGKGIVREIIAISQGEGRNLVQDNLGGLEYTGRIEFLPFGSFKSKGDYIGADISRESKPKLSLAFTYDYNDRAVKTQGNQGRYMIDGSGENRDGFFHSNIKTIFVDMMFKYKGFSLMGEYAFRDADEAKLYNSDSTWSSTVYTGQGINLQAGYLLKNNWEVAGRYTLINPGKITGRSDFEQYTFGISKYFSGHALKVQSDVSYLRTYGSADGTLMYRLQFDIHF